MQGSSITNVSSKNTIKSKPKEFNFNKKDDSRPISKESDSRTSTSTPFQGVRNTLNADIVEENPNCDAQTMSMLESLKLQKYSEMLGETPINQITDEFLTDLQIPLGHKLKILKKIKELKPKVESEEEEKRSTNFKYQSSNGMPKREVTYNEYDELPYQVNTCLLFAKWIVHSENEFYFKELHLAMLRCIKIPI